MATRLSGRCGYPRDNPFQVTMHSERLDEPRRWKKPCRVFVCSMGDFWHKDVPQWFQHDVLEVVRQCPQHTFQFLTKRPERAAAMDWKCNLNRADYSTLPNLWLGTTCENQASAEARIPHLLRCPAAVRFLSCEPLLGPIDIRQWLGTVHNDQFGGDRDEGYGPWVNGIGWVIAGGENGSGARPSHPDWFRTVRDQCAAASVPFFFKAWGAWCPGEFGTGIPDCLGGQMDNPEFFHYFDDPPYKTWRVGKARAGRLLDGREHLEVPKP